MARNIARLQQGYFPFPPNLVPKVAERLVTQGETTFPLLDAGSGEGVALELLRENMLRQYPSSGASFPLWGIESDKDRAKVAHERFAATGGKCLWGRIEECKPVAPPSLLWFNPPYDVVRGAGRLETILLEEVVDWLKPGKGVFVGIVPEYVMDDKATGFQSLVHQYFDDISVLRFPNDEYRRCAVLGRRRERKLYDYYGTPTIADVEKYTLHPSTLRSVVRRTLSDDVLWHAVQESRLRGTLLKEVSRGALAVERPPGILGTGHVVMLVASGFCDGAVDVDGQSAIVRGSLLTGTKHTQTAILNADAKQVGTCFAEQTRYSMLVRALRPDGTIEEYSSDQDSEEDAADAAKEWCHVCNNQPSRFATL